MKNLLQWMIFYSIAVVTVWLLMFGLVVGGIVLQFKALVLWLTPLLGPAGAYSVTGLMCFGVVVFSALVMKIWLRPGGVSRKQGEQPDGAGTVGEDPYASARVVLEKYPLESVLAAFAVGLSVNDAEELKKMAGTFLREAPP